MKPHLQLIAAAFGIANLIGLFCMGILAVKIDPVMAVYGGIITGSLSAWALYALGASKNAS